MKILNIYSSINGQTSKVAEQIEKACRNSGKRVETINVSKENQNIDLLKSDLIFIGSGVYTWLPPKPMLKWIEAQVEKYRKAGLIFPGSPRIPGKSVVVYTTFAGPHTGEAEAIPAIKYMGQLFDHLGITIRDEWTIPSAFIPEKMQALNKNGRLGNITDRPNKNDLMAIHQRVEGLISALLPESKAVKLI